MIIGVPKEIKTEERRVGLTPIGVKALTGKGHKVFIEQDAGVGSGFTDDDYIKAGATISKDAKELYANATLIVKIKEPQPAEYELLSKNHLLFTYLHLAANETLTKRMLDIGLKAFAYESLDINGRLPLLEPMSEIAGKMAALVGANLLASPSGGKGILLSGVTGVRRGNVVVLGAGTVGTNAAQIASGLGANVVVLDIDGHKLAEVSRTLEKNVSTLYSNEASLREIIPNADLLIGAILQKDAKTPRIITETMIKSMKPGSVLVDVSIDQGGCAATSRPTTHKEPTFEKYGVIHYCVANMPGAYAQSATMALSSNTLPYITMLAELGFDKTLMRSEAMSSALNMADGKLYNKEIANTFNLPHHSLKA